MVKEAPRNIWPKQIPVHNILASSVVPRRFSLVDDRRVLDLVGGTFCSLTCWEGAEKAEIQFFFVVLKK